MVARAYTVAFEGIEARLVEVQCAISPGIPAFSMVCYIEKLLLISSWFKITKADIGESRSEGLERAQCTGCCNLHRRQLGAGTGHSLRPAPMSPKRDLVCIRSSCANERFQLIGENSRCLRCQKRLSYG